MRCPHCGAETPLAEVPVSEATRDPICPRCGKTCSFDDCEGDE